MTTTATLMTCAELAEQLRPRCPDVPTSALPARSIFA